MKKFLFALLVLVISCNESEMAESWRAKLLLNGTIKVIYLKKGYAIDDTIVYDYEKIVLLNKIQDSAIIK
jgi:hypothetical protein